MSAGFGFSGLVGPINHLNLTENGWTVTNILITILVFVVAPITFGFISKYVFMKVWPIVSPEDYRLDIK
ncbi:MAG: PTS sugar transporter subunit IIC, partial [Alkalibacterium gilvum]